jgi:DNA polymerase I-like protein with 3'-5' exonuclease and polymerase domains
MPQIDLFGDIVRPNKASDKAIAKKSNAKSKKSPATVKGSGLSSKIELARKFVEEHLGKYKNEYLTITDEQVLKKYVSDSGNAIGIDTETSGLDPMQDKIIGICLHSPNTQPAYIPLRHKSHITGELLDNQLSPNVVADILKPLESADEDIMFNAKFDMRFMHNDLGVDLHCTWDCYLAGRLMNENEPNKGLKALHSKYVLEGAEDEFSFGEIFKDIPFEYIPIDIATLYGAHDAVITWELYQFQKQYLYYNPEETFESRNSMNGVAWCFFNIEMPCIEAVCSMEDNGVLLDKAYASHLSEVYTQKRDTILNEFYNALEQYSDAIQAYRMQNDKCKLDNPINIASPTQLAILFYDILGCEVIDKKSPRGTGIDILKKMNNPIADIILEYRAIDKLLGTYIDKLPNCVNPNDGKIHCSFNQYGADTGRFSSSDPNMQNIPSHNKDIRKMFVASDGYVLMSSDFSQQEPKALAALCRIDGDSQMYDTFMQGKDLYSEIASKAFNKPYEECLEFNPDGSTNKEGKERRTQAKSILLGVLYGRGTASIGEQLHCTTEKADAIKNSVFRGFPAIKRFEQESLDFAYENGYVTTIGGRKRRLPDLMLDEYEFKWIDAPKTDDVLDFEGDIDTEVPDEICNKYLRKLHQARFGQKRKIFEEANKKDGIWIIDNGAKIADSTRQCVNSRIQGSAADLTKLAMIELYKSEKLKKLGFRLLIQVHDEIIAECPEENVEECSKLLAETMSKAAEKLLEMPIKCDVTITREWYGEAIEL